MGEGGGSGELTPPQLGLSQGPHQLMAEQVSCSSFPSHEAAPSAHLGVSAPFLVFTFIFPAFFWPSQIHCQEPPLLVRNKSPLCDLCLFGGEPASKQWPRNNHKLTLLLLVTSSTRKFTRVFAGFQPWLPNLSGGAEALSHVSARQGLYFGSFQIIKFSTSAFGIIIVLLPLTSFS